MSVLRFLTKRPARGYPAWFQATCALGAAVILLLLWLGLAMPAVYVSAVVLGAAIVFALVFDHRAGR